MKRCGILICVGERYKILKHPIRGSVGTGRRARLRILWWLHRVGSSPIFRTKDSSRKTWVFLRYRENSDRCGEPGDWGDGTGIVKLMYECVFWGKCHAKCNTERRKSGWDEHQRAALYPHLWEEQEKGWWKFKIDDISEGWLQKMFCEI